MGLSADLLALGETLGPEDPQWGDPELPQATLCPRLRTTYSPRASWWDPDAPAPSEGPEGRQWARLWDPGPPAPDLGSSLAPNSERPPRYGLKGLPSAGRRQVWRSLALLEERRELLLFWTVTLPEEALLQLAKRDSLPAFQDRLRKELQRQLVAAGAPPLVLGVVELQPGRTMRERRPAPHWHVVFVGRRSRRKGDCYLSFDQLDGVIRSALTSAGVGPVDLKAAGRTENIRKSVKAYLAKYMSKGSQDVASWPGGPWEALLPRQWWFWSRPLRAWVLEHVLPIAFPFLLWVHDHRQGLQERGLIAHRLVPLSDPRAPSTWEISWLSCENVATLVYLWQTDQWDAQWFRTNRLSYGSPDPGEHPQQHQHLRTIVGVGSAVLPEHCQRDGGECDRRG